MKMRSIQLLMFATYSILASVQVSFADDTEGLMTPELKVLVQRLESATQEHPSLIHFSLTEALAQTSPDSSCLPVASDRIADFLKDIAEGLLAENGCDSECSSAIEMLRASSQRMAFLECHRSLVAVHVFTDVREFIAVDGSRSLKFELGYSD